MLRDTAFYSMEPAVKYLQLNRHRFEFYIRTTPSLKSSLASVSEVKYSRRVSDALSFEMRIIFRSIVEMMEGTGQSFDTTCLFVCLRKEQSWR